MESIIESLIKFLCQLLAIVWEGGCFASAPESLAALLTAVTL